MCVHVGTGCCRGGSKLSARREWQRVCMKSSHSSAIPHCCSLSFRSWSRWKILRSFLKLLSSEV